MIKAKGLGASVLVLGTSREDYGINPSDIPINGVKYNGATTSQPYIESRLTLEYMKKHNIYPQHILLGLLFELSDVNSKLPVDFDKDRIYGDKKTYSNLISLDTTKSSLKTFWCNAFKKTCSDGYFSNGLRYPLHFEKASAKNGQHHEFIENEKHYMRDNHNREPLCQPNPFINKDTGYSKMSELKALIHLAYEQKTDLRMFIGPSHARQWETIKISGLWDKFEQWKRILVDINEKEANFFHKSPFPIWDFSGYNSITSEELPEIGDKASRMKYYFESSHYTPLTGKLVINKIYGSTEKDNSLNNFGVNLTSGNLKLHFLELRKEQEKWENNHQRDMSELYKSKKDVDLKKVCVKPL